MNHNIAYSSGKESYFFNEPELRTYYFTGADTVGYLFIICSTDLNLPKFRAYSNFYTPLFMPFVHCLFNLSIFFNSLTVLCICYNTI